MFLSMLCLAFAAHLIQGASQCVRTNSEPSRDCAVKCTVQTDCGKPREKCLCDGDCGYSCVIPRMRCSKPRKVRNGQIIFKSYRFNATQRAACNAGFRLTGSAVRTCRGNGYWDGKQARCRRAQKNCQDPGMKGLLLRTAEETTSFKPGTKLSYYCPLKFILRGSRELICNGDGTWSASLPKCIAPKCRPAVLPAHTQVTSPRNWRNRRKYGIRFILSCDNGYTSTQRGTLVCDPPGWRLEPSSFECSPVTPRTKEVLISSKAPTTVLKVTTSGLTTTQYLTTSFIKSCQDPGTPWRGNKNGNLQVGQTLHFSCHQCYKLKGSPTRTCQSDLSWSGSQPTCTAVRCSGLHHPRNGRITAYSYYCPGRPTEFTCYSGYQLSDSRKLTCHSNGKWSADIPTCVLKSCQDPGTPWRGNKNGNLHVGQTLHFSCDQCYKLTGSPNRTCQSGLSWSGSQPTCTAVRCSGLHRPRNGRIAAYSNYCHGRPTEFTCYSGYQLSDSRKLTCQSNGKWSAAIPTCVPKSCPDPGRPRNGDVKGLFIFGEKVYYTCDQCYKLKGPGYRQCQADQEWTDTQPTCEPVTCSFLQNPVNGYLTSNSQQCDSIVQYHCDDGYQLNGSPRRRCQSNATWTGNETLCEHRNLNIALGKPVTMSSFWKLHSGPASVAVDGKRSGILLHTNYEYGSWVKIDLQQEDTVSTVIVVNRIDCCATRTNGFKVSVGNNGNKAGANTECGGRSVAKRGPNIIQCRTMLRGRYVFVYMPEKRHTVMALLEVEVYRRRMTE